MNKRGIEMGLKFKKTIRGLSRAEFKDLYYNDCSIQESSLANQDAIWFGCDLARMHLSVDQVSILIPALQHFVETGRLPSRNG